MSLDLALSIARGGLAHVNRQLAVAAGNVANSATPGYTRKEVQGAATAPVGLAAGVRSLEAARAVDGALVVQMNASRATVAAETARARLLERVEIAHGPIGASIGDLTAALGDALVSLRGDPSDTLLQGAATDAAGDLSARYNTVSAAVQEARQGAQDAMVLDVESLNAGLRRISELTDRILPLRAQGLSTAELEDRRDTAIAELSSVMQLRAVGREDGNVTLITEGGLTLPLHHASGPFTMAAASVGPGSFHGGAGTLPGVLLNGSDVTDRLGNGSLAAYAALRDTELPLRQAELDVSAANLAARFDAQGLRLFTGGAGAVPDPATPYATGGWIGFASAIGVNPDVAADPRLVRDGTHAVAGGGTGPTAFTPNPATGPAEFRALLDRVLDRSLGAEASPGNPHPPFAATGLGPDGSVASTLRSSRSLGDYASGLVASQTASRAGAEEAGRAAGDLLSTLEARFAERSGVDMDKELAAMVTMQTAYAANARIVSVVQSMYDALLQAVR